jgi:hypothetical protein
MGGIMGMAMKDVREQLSDLVKRATYRGEQITFGPNRGDEVTLIATEQVRRMAARLKEAEERLMELLRERARPGAFAGLQEALASGELAVRGDDSRARRVLPNLATESPLTRDDRIRLGARDARVPEFRRTRPRA